MEVLRRSGDSSSRASSAQLSDDTGAEVLYFGGDGCRDATLDSLLFGE